MEDMEGDGEDGEEHRRNGVGAGDALKVRFSYGADIWDRELGSDGGHIKSNIVFPSSGSQNDGEEYGLAYDEWRVGIASSGRHAREIRYLTNKGIYPE